MSPTAAAASGWPCRATTTCFYVLAAVLTMTAGTVFLMWLGEQIDEYGIGNGISLIIMAGIVARIPDATKTLLFDSTTGELQGVDLHPRRRAAASDISFEKLLVLIVLFVAVVVAVIAITKGQRRIPTQSAKHVRGRRVYGGTRQFLPLRVNQAGVMPVIFASSLLMLPVFVFKFLTRLLPLAAGLAMLSRLVRAAGLHLQRPLHRPDLLLLLLLDGHHLQPEGHGQQPEGLRQLHPRLPARQAHRRLPGTGA